MTKTRLSGFPDDSTVTISALKNGVSHGPITVSAWKRTPITEPGAITFEVYSPVGFGKQYPYGERGARADMTNRELVDGATIEIAQYAPIGLLIENVQGAATDDFRNLFFEIDFGERWDAQYLEHSNLPAGFTTMAPDGAAMGRYPMHAAGHVMRGADMAGNTVLTKDYNAGNGLPPGVKETTITVTVSDGLHTATKTFKVQISHWLRFYTDTASIKTYAPNVFHDGRGDNRRGVVYMSQDGDFSGAEFGPGIYHYTVPNGIIRKSGMWGFWTNEKASDGMVLRDTATATQIIGGVACDAGGSPVPTRTDFPFHGGQTNTLCILFKAGETWRTTEELNQTELVNGPNSLFDTWGGGRVTLSGENRQTWGNFAAGFMKTNSSGEYYGMRFRNIDFHMSDYDPSDITWREWWNLLYYTNKSGAFLENTNDHIGGGAPWNGEMIRNAGGTVWTQLIADLDNGDGTGCFVVRQVMDSSGLGGNAAVFSDGDTLFADASGGTATFVQTPAPGKEARVEADPDGQSRQDRARKTPPSFWAGLVGHRTSGRPGMIGICFDACEVRGARTAFYSPGSWIFRSDTLVKNFWDYGFLGSSWMLFDSGFVVAQPASYPGEIRDTADGNTDNKRTFNTLKARHPTVPVRNEPTHCVLRIDEPTTVSMYKCGAHQYGGHTDGTDHSDPWVTLPYKGGGQPTFRLQATNTFDATSLAVYGCFFSGGGIAFSTFESHPVTRYYWTGIVDKTWIRCSGMTAVALRIYQSNMAFKNCRIGWPSGITLGQRARNAIAKNDVRLAYMPDFTDHHTDEDASALPDLQKVTFYQDCDFEFGAVNASKDSTNLSWTTVHRGRTVPFLGTNTLTIHDISPGVPALDPARVDPVPA